MQIFCPECGQRTVFQPEKYCCDCGGAWEPIEAHHFTVNKIDKEIPSLWRYQQIFNLDGMNNPISLGAGWTPLLETDIRNFQVMVKVESMAPTGSFKDRGTELELNYLRAIGIKDVVEDSSGNAGASLAAYAARLGLRASIYAPESASQAKLGQIEVFGAQLHKIPGARIEATKAALKAVETGAIYASHAYNPIYLLGQQSFSWEIWEQLNGQMPDAVVIPVGQGGLLMGAWLGFRRLCAAGLAERTPRLFAVQPQRLAPISQAFRQGLEDTPVVETGENSMAEGLAIVKPVRAKRILQALRQSSGAGLVVREEDILLARDELAHKGFFVEPSSAVVAAVLEQVMEICGDKARVVLALTGNGLKTTW